MPENTEARYQNFSKTFRTVKNGETRLLLIESLVIVIFHVIFLMCYAVIINYFGKKIFFHCRENRG